jgi:hypothetical protein
MLHAYRIYSGLVYLVLSLRIQRNITYTILQLISIAEQLTLTDAHQSLIAKTVLTQ